MGNSKWFSGILQTEKTNVVYVGGAGTEQNVKSGYKAA